MLISTDTAIVTVDASAEEFGLTLSRGERYLLLSTTAAWFRPTTEGGTAASAAAGSTLLPAGTPLVLMAGGDLPRISIVRASADGLASLTRLG